MVQSPSDPRVSAHEMALQRPSAELAEEGESSPFLPGTQQDHLRVPSPAVLSALVRRCRALAVKLLPTEIKEKSITSREGIVNRKVLEAFSLAGGDYNEAVPYALLESARQFKKDAEKDEKALSEQRALLCQVIARRLVAKSEAAWIEQRASAFRNGDIPHGPWAAAGSHLGLLKKYAILKEKNEATLPKSTLELAVDTGSTIFLSCPEVQRCVNALWSGHLVKNYRADGTVIYEPYHEVERPGFWSHFHPSRLAVPKYSYYLSILLWIVFLILYTISTRAIKTLDIWEVLLWLFAAGYLFDDISRWFKIRGLDSLDFWLIVDVLTDALFVTAFTVRMIGFGYPDGSPANEHWQLRAFQFLACLAPLIWLQLLKISDPLQYFGIIQVVILAMLKETASFFILLVIVCVGFGQALYALDTADGRQVENVLQKLTDSLTQSILGDPDYDLVAESFGYPFGRILYYILTFMTTLILGNILVALFADAYSDIVGRADEEYAAYFAQKVVDLTRAPDEYVYVPPFNLLEFFIIIPCDFFLNRDQYARVNHAVQNTLFFVPLSIIAFYESIVDSKEARRRRERSFEGLSDDHDRAAEEGQQGTLEDPSFAAEEEQSGMKLAKIPFSKLVSNLPNSQEYVEGKTQEEERQTEHDIRVLMEEVRALRKELAETRTSSSVSSSVKKEYQ